MSKILGFIVGAVFGAFAFSLIRLGFGWGLTVIPINELLVQILPGLFAGGILGVKFHRVIERAVHSFW
jgi:hypothetical protein